MEDPQGADSANVPSILPETERTDPVTGAGLRSTLFRNTLAGGLSNMVAVLSAVILTPLVIREFGAAVYGVWILINQLTSSAGLLDMGVQPAVSKRVAEARRDGRGDSLLDFLASAFWLHVTIATVTLVLGLAFSAVFPVWFHIDSVAPGDARLAVIVVGITTAMGFPSGLLSALLKGKLRFDLVSWIGIVAQVFRVVGLGVVLAYRGGLIGLALTGLMTATVTLACGTFATFRVLGPRFLFGGRPAWSHIREIARFGGFNLLANAGWYLAYATDAAIIGVTLTLTDVAHFGLALNVLTIMSGVVGAFSSTLMPVAARLETRGRHSDTRETYLVTTRICLTLIIPAVVAFLLAGPDILSLWVGREFGTATSSILQVLLFAHLAVIVNGPGFHMGMGVGLVRPIAFFFLAEGFLNVALSYVLAKRIGVIGVAIGTLIPSMLSHGIAMPAFIRSRLGISTRQFLGRSIAPALWPLGPAVFVGAMWWWLARPVGRTGTIVWAAAVCLAYVTIATAVFLVSRRRSA